MSAIPEPAPVVADHPEVDNFWELARAHAHLNVAPGYFGPTALESVPPPAWSFGSTPGQADELLALVLDGTKTATASALSDYPDGNLPEPGSLSILLDSGGTPQALIATTEVQVVPFDEVGADHARAEGEGDLSLEYWRTVHREFFGAAATGESFGDLAVVLERFEVVYRR